MPLQTTPETDAQHAVPPTANAQQSPSTSTTNKNNGIDIHKALDILAERSASGGHGHDHDHSGEGGGCHTHQTEEKRSMGQTIDLEGKAEETSSTMTEQDAEATRKEQEERRQQRAVELERTLQSMTVQELLQTVMETQQQRVATYHDYNEGLKQVLESGNMTAYITSCAHATAAFSVLSETIIAIRKTLVQTHKRHDLEKLLTNLQAHEKEKLNLTAALHLEQIREQNENVGSVDRADQRISKLLSEGVKSLRQKVASCIEDINEALEEIRYALLEEGDDENDDDDEGAAEDA